MKTLVRMEHELMFLKNELTTLEAIDEEKPCDEVEIGAVVVTDQRIFFICTSVDVVEVNGQSFFGISTKAPIYHVMKGKKEGDCFEFSGVRYLILDVYCEKYKLSIHAKRGWQIDASPFLMFKE